MINPDHNPPRCMWILNGCGVVGDSISGGPARFHEISSRWKRDGLAHQHLLTTSGGAAMLGRLGSDIPMTIVPAALLLRSEPFRAFRLWSYILSAAMAPRILFRQPFPDVVLTASDYFCDVWPASRMKRRYPSARWIAFIYHKETPPNLRPGCYAINALTWRMQEWSFAVIARHADQAWVSANEAGDNVALRLQELGMPPERVRRIVNGVDLDAIRHVPPPEKTVDAVTVGVRPNKGMFDIVPVWRAVQELRPGTTLRLMGGMSGENKVLNEIKRHDLEHVIAMLRPDGGCLPPGDYFPKIKEARLLFAPSHEEGWGIAVCEAMACGVPVVSYDLPVYRAIYGDALAVVPCFDHRAFAARIVSVLSDDATRRGLIERGLSRASLFDWNRIAVDDLNAIHKMLKERECHGVICAETVLSKKT